MRCVYFDATPIQVRPECKAEALWEGLCYDHATRRFGDGWITNWNATRKAALLRFLAREEATDGG